MDYDKESKRWRDLWLMAIGAGMADESLRPRLVGYAPGDLADLVRWIRENNKVAGWQELAKWGLKPANGELAVSRLFAELDRLEHRRTWVTLATDLGKAIVDDDAAKAKEKAAELLRVIDGGAK